MTFFSFHIILLLIIVMMSILIASNADEQERLERILDRGECAPMLNSMQNSFSVSALFRHLPALCSDRCYSPMAEYATGIAVPQNGIFAHLEELALLASPQLLCATADNGEFCVSHFSRHRFLEYERKHSVLREAVQDESLLCCAEAFATAFNSSSFNSTSFHNSALSNNTALAYRIGADLSSSNTVGGACQRVNGFIRVTPAASDADNTLISLLGTLAIIGALVAFVVTFMPSIISGMDGANDKHNHIKIS